MPPFESYSHPHHGVPRNPTQGTNAYPGTRPYTGPVYHTHPGMDVDRIGDYVARRLVPVMMNRSERPLSLVMNFGQLFLEDGFNAQQSPDRHSRRAGGSIRNASNAVIYNAPGCTMTIASSAGAEKERHLLRRGYDDSLEERRVATCLNCYRRQLVGPANYCKDCELLDPAVRYLGSRPFGRGLHGLDGIRYVSERDRPLGRERLFPQTGYFSDSERSWYSS